MEKRPPMLLVTRVVKKDCSGWYQCCCCKSGCPDVPLCCTWAAMVIVWVLRQVVWRAGRSKLPDVEAKMEE
eukprot:10031025-Ditylum_brightwellii.AAC.1